MDCRDSTGSIFLRMTSSGDVGSNRCVVQYAPYARPDEPVDDRLRLGRRDRHDADGDLRRVHSPVQLGHRPYGYVADPLPHEPGVAVEGRYYAESRRREAWIVDYRLSKIPNADQAGRPAPVEAQDVAQLVPQVGHAVALALLSELTQVAEVLPYLGWALCE